MSQRCETGKRLIQIWLDHYNQTKTVEVFLEKREYDTHLKTCLICQMYEQNKKQEKPE